MHSNLIYSALDDRFNVVSLPYIYDDYADADEKFDGQAGLMLKNILEDLNLHCFGIAENGFRQLTNSKRPVKSPTDLKGLKIRVAGSNLLMQSYKAWGANATNMNWSETYTSLQQGTVEGQENPLPSIASASVQDVQKYISMWNAYYDCLFFCMNGDVYNSFSPEQQAVLNENAQKAIDYERAINRFECDKLIAEWKERGIIEVVPTEEVDTKAFKDAASGVIDWYKNQLIATDGYPADEVEKLISLFAE